MKSSPVRLGILGLRRGAYFADVFKASSDVRMAAVCGFDTIAMARPDSKNRRFYGKGEFSSPA